MSIVETFTKDTLLKRIEGLNTPVSVALNSDTVALGNPAVVSGAHNTQLKLTGTSLFTEGYEDVLVGTVSVAYDRLDLTKLFKGVPLRFTIPDDSDITNLYGYLPSLSNLIGVQLFEEDVADVTITATTDKVVVKALATSLNVTGSFEIKLNVPPLDLSKLSGGLAIFVDNTTVSDIKDNQMDGLGLTALTFNARRLTEGYDFTKYSSILSLIRENGSNINGGYFSSFSKVLKAEFGINWLTNSVYLISFSDADGWRTITAAQPNSRDKFIVKYKL